MLTGGIGCAALFEAEVVVGADAGENGDFDAARAGAPVAFAPEQSRTATAMRSYRNIYDTKHIVLQQYSGRIQKPQQIGPAK